MISKILRDGILAIVNFFLCLVFGHIWSGWEFHPQYGGDEAYETRFCYGCKKKEEREA